MKRYKLNRIVIIYFLISWMLGVLMIFGALSNATGEFFYVLLFF